MTTQEEAKLEEWADAEIASWCPGLEQELAEAEKAVPPLQAAYNIAVAAADEAAAKNRAIQKKLSKAHGQRDYLGEVRFHFLEEPLGIRAAVFAQAVDEARQKRARAKADLDKAKAEVTKRRRALIQIDVIVPPADESQEAA